MRDKIVNIVQLIVVFTAMTVSGCMAFTLRIISFGYLTDFNRKYLVPLTSRMTLALVGIRLDLPKKNPLGQGNYFITFNHNSYLDGFALTALGYTRTHLLLSEKMIKVIPATLIALAIGVWFIPQKKYLARRLNFFDRIEKRIVKNNVNVAGSSEGVHPHVHGIAPFNRGVYHMAVVCKMNIIPLFIYVPEESNPFDDYRSVKSGTIRVEIMEIIDTSDWTLENLDAHKDAVRDMYVKRFNELNNTQVV